MKALNGFLMIQREMTLKVECGYIYSVRELHRPCMSDAYAFLADTVDTTIRVVRLRFCGYIASLDRYAQLTRCFSAVAELLVLLLMVCMRNNIFE